jgi:hypothetical protein
VGGNYPRLILYKLDELRAKTTPDLEFRTRQDIAIFREDGFGDVKPGWPGERKEEHGALESLRFQSGRHEDVSIDDDAERDHRLQVIVLQTTFYRPPFTDYGLQVALRFLCAGAVDDLINLG